MPDVTTLFTLSAVTVSKVSTSKTERVPEVESPAFVSVIVSALLSVPIT